VRLVLASTNPLGESEILGRWAEARIPHLFLDTLGPYAAFGIVDEQDVIRGVALYHGWAPRYRGIEISFVLDSPRWLTQSVIAGILSYPFSQLQCLRVTAATPSWKSARPTRRFLERFGFKREGLARKGFGPYGDAVIYGLTQRDWAESAFNRGARLSVEKRLALASTGS
jgi:RimJ/RimL family protein N-acetyltransferase